MAADPAPFDYDAAILEAKQLVRLFEEREEGCFTWGDAVHKRVQSIMRRFGYEVK